MAAQGSGRHSPSMNEYAKIIHSETDYALLPTRQIYPENFKHPITSLESKKALLMSMQPMLSAAEKQRKTDSELLENFTRCKVGKSRARSSTYEYLDFDTNLRISGKEYSRRYVNAVKLERYCLYYLIHISYFVVNWTDISFTLLRRGQRIILLLISAIFRNLLRAIPPKDNACRTHRRIEPPKIIWFCKIFPSILLIRT